MEVSNEYVLKCMSAKPFIRYTEFEVGDNMTVHGVPEIHVLSTKTIKVDRTNTEVCYAIPIRLHYAQLNSSVPELTYDFDKIDFRLYPEEYWTKIFTIDQILDMMKGTIENKLQALTNYISQRSFGLDDRERMFDAFMFLGYGVEWNHIIKVYHPVSNYGVLCTTCKKIQWGTRIHLLYRCNKCGSNEPSTFVNVTTEDFRKGYYDKK